MPSGHRWSCKDCNEYFYTYNRPLGAPTLSVDTIFCPNKKTGCIAQYSRSIKVLQEQHNPMVDSAAASRKRRISPTEMDKREQKMKLAIDLDEEDPEDSEFVQQLSHFKAEMRYTAAVLQPVLPKGRNCERNNAKLKAVQVGSPAVRANQSAAMGGRQAWAIAGRTDYSADKYTSSEWCHLQGAALGGPTNPNNLASASFAANSEMFVMEMLLRGKTDLFITVKVYTKSLVGDDADVAEYIKYIIRSDNVRNKGKDYVRWIDGRSDGFSELDAKALTKELSAWLKKNRKPYAVQLDNLT